MCLQSKKIRRDKEWHTGLDMLPPSPLVAACDCPCHPSNVYRSMDKLRMVGNIDIDDFQQSLKQRTQIVGRTAIFAGWTEDNKSKAALFRLRGEASDHIEQLRSEGQIKLIYL